ncbi:hypothetical protein RB195_018567 [Necator americanus]|uniref:Uncharacterized protein n=1 Tax=Necator americanus TaxID=51031 RepID=A0ABR1CE15_NECAM
MLTDFWRKERRQGMARRSDKNCPCSTVLESWGTTSISSERIVILSRGSEKDLTSSGRYVSVKKECW